MIIKKKSKLKNPDTKKYKGIIYHKKYVGSPLIEKGVMRWVVCLVEPSSAKETIAKISH